MKPMRIAPTPCPYCGKVYDSAMPPKDNARLPKAGDLTICPNCGELVVFGPFLNLMECKETPEELAERLGLVVYGDILLAQEEIKGILLLKGKYVGDEKSA